MELNSLANERLEKVLIFYSLPGGRYAPAAPPVTQNLGPAQLICESSDLRHYYRAQLLSEELSLRSLESYLVE
jgi:hypothetical protein